jgi:hypothetical protein
MDNPISIFTMPFNRIISDGTDRQLQRVAGIAETLETGH